MYAKVGMDSDSLQPLLYMKHRCRWVNKIKNHCNLWSSSSSPFESLCHILYKGSVFGQIAFSVQYRVRMRYSFCPLCVSCLTESSLGKVMSLNTCSETSVPLLPGILRCQWNMNNNCSHAWMIHFWFFNKVFHFTISFKSKKGKIGHFKEMRHNHRP